MNKNQIPAAIQNAAAKAARTAIIRGDVPPDARFFVECDEDPDKNPVYSLWRYLAWYPQKELVDVLEVAP